MSPTLSTPEAWAMSITLATSAKGTLSSPLTNITFSARVLKISVSRACKPSQVVSSLLILTPGSFPAPRSINCTTMVRSGVLFFGAFGGGGCGTSASSPFGVSGVITMKMISNTSSTSMRGVTLIFALWPPPALTPIPIRSPLLPARRRWRLGSSFLLVGQQTQLVDSGGADVVHYRHHRSELGPGISADEYALVKAVSQAVLHLLRKLIGRGLVIAEEDLSISHDRHNQSIFLVGVRHLLRIVHLGQVHAHTLLQH